MADKKLWEVHVRDARTGRKPGEYLWIIAKDSELAIRKAEKFARARYGTPHRVYKLEQHGTVDVL